MYILYISKRNYYLKLSVFNYLEVVTILSRAYEKTKHLYMSYYIEVILGPYWF